MSISQVYACRKCGQDLAGHVCPMKTAVKVVFGRNIAAQTDLQITGPPLLREHNGDGSPAYRTSIGTQTEVGSNGARKRQRRTQRISDA